MHVIGMDVCKTYLSRYAGHVLIYAMGLQPKVRTLGGFKQLLIARPGVNVNNPFGMFDEGEQLLPKVGRLPENSCSFLLEAGSPSQKVEPNEKLKP